VPHYRKALSHAGPKVADSEAELSRPTGVGSHDVFRIAIHVFIVVSWLVMLVAA
jgi:hypothetical protein